MVRSANDVKLAENAFEGHLKVVRDLLLAGADVNARGATGVTALISASTKNYVDIVRLLLQQSNVDVNAQDSNGATALVVASSRGHLEAVRLLLENNVVDVNLPMNGGRTPLMVASANGHVNVIDKLLKKNKVDVNAISVDGETALYMASVAGHEDVVRKLLENNNVDATIKCNKGSTPLDATKQKTLERIFWDHEMLHSAGENRGLLGLAMIMRNIQPVVLSYHYIVRCITNRKLGSGAFGDVFIAEGSDLPEPKKFAVKMIKLSQRSDDPEDLKYFQKDLVVRSMSPRVEQ
jgi:hypothetical protein